MSQSPPIEDYALIGNTTTAALVCRSGSLDWLCAPRFDSSACFAALLGGPEHGHWLIAPAHAPCATHRRYREGSLVLETEFENAAGAVRLIDFMSCPPRKECIDVLRVVCGLRGTMLMRMSLLMRFDYGRIVPWVRREEGGLRAVAGPESLRLHAPVELVNENYATHARFSVVAGERRAFTLTWSPSFQRAPLADHAQGAHLRADGRHRRRADDLAARATRRRAQLGLPVLLVARRGLHSLRLAHLGLHR